MNFHLGLLRLQNRTLRKALASFLAPSHCLHCFSGGDRELVSRLLELLAGDGLHGPDSNDESPVSEAHVYDTQLLLLL